MKKTLLLTLLTIAGLLSLYYLPEIHIWQGETLRKVNLLADVRKMTYSKSESEKLIAEAERERKQLLGQDTIPPGVTPIEDFSAMDSIRIMDGFYKKLNNIHTMTRPIRIAYYGDSFIEGDILTCDLRELLQNKYGGCGVGAVNIIYPFSYARGTILQSEEGLTEHVSSNPKQFKKELQGLNNFYATADSIASAKFQGTKNQFGSHLDKWDYSLLYFRPKGDATVKASINSTPYKTIYSGKSDKLQMAKVEGNIRTIEWHLEGNGNIYYIIANEGHQGITLDNFALRGATGRQLIGIPQETLNEFATLRPYDLIIMQYGLNVASPSVRTYDPFVNDFKQIIANFRKAWPDAAIMLISTSDHGKAASGGTSKTVEGIEKLVVTQRELAKDRHIAFWNMFSAMGGAGSIGRMAKDGEANKDYTHMNFKGGKKLAQKLYDALMTGLLNYNRRLRTINDINQKVDSIKKITK